MVQFSIGLKKKTGFSEYCLLHEYCWGV